MIGKLIGTVEEIFTDHVLLLVNSVGYIVYLAPKVLASCHEGEQYNFFIVTHIRENVIQLYGVRERQELDMLRCLITVKGVSCKLATVMLSVHSPDKIYTAILSSDSKSLQAPGIGAKLAARIVTELSASIAKKGMVLGNNLNKRSEEENIGPISSMYKDIISALCNLGFKEKDIVSVVRSILSEYPDIALDAAITMSLKKLQ